jgi:hypothetical protein
MAGWRGYAVQPCEVDPMSIIDFVIDTLEAGKDIIDLYFVQSDLYDVDISEAERVENAENDALCDLRGGALFDGHGDYTHERYNGSEQIGKLSK